jgi:hypothetical protein
VFCVFTGNPSKNPRMSPAMVAHDNRAGDRYIGCMRKFVVFIPLIALLAVSLWFAGTAWVHLSGDGIPLYGYVAIAGGVLMSLAVGGGLMALVFYSNRHGYDDDAGTFGDGDAP